MYPPRFLECASDEVIEYSLMVGDADDAARPLEELTHMDWIERYARLAHLREREGVDKLVLRGLPGLVEARAALLGARLARLPVYVIMELSGGYSREEFQQRLAALLCLQAIGASGFGFAFQRVEGELVALYAELAPYAAIPLLALSGEAVTATYTGRLVQAGVDLFCGGFAEDEGVRELLAAAKPVPRPPRTEDAPLLLCDASGVYYLEEDFTLSPPVACSLDMSEEILAMEEDAVDALCFRVEDVADAMNLGRNAHMCRRAACIQAAGEEALEMALTLYPGRVLVDARTGPDENRLRAIAAVYGAIVR